MPSTVMKLIQCHYLLLMTAPGHSHIWCVIIPAYLWTRGEEVESGPLPFPDTAAHPAVACGPGAQRHSRIWDHLFDVSTWVGHKSHLLSFFLMEGRGGASGGLALWEETKHPSRFHLSTLGPSAIAVSLPQPWQSHHMSVLLTDTKTLTLG